MKNLDVQNKALDEARNDFAAALQSDDVKNVVEAQVKFMEIIKNDILQEAQKFGRMGTEETSDLQALAMRGLQPLTSYEKKYYNEVIQNGGFDGLEKALPTTTINRVFEDLRLSRPLLSKINFVNTTALTEWLIRKSGAQAAWWGPLCSDIKKQLEGSFELVRTDLFKLSAFIPVCKAMLDLGPEWLDRFVRELLGESMAMALELAIIAGSGDTQPIGMTKDLSGAVTLGIYPDKAKEALNSLTPVSLGKHIMSPLTKDGKRTVGSVLIIVNPVDYWEKIFPQTTILSSTGNYVYGVLPIPADIICSSALEKGTMIAGMAEDYFLGVGSSQNVLYSDEYQFLEDNRVYLIKQYANGKPKDNESFLVFDISGMEASESLTTRQKAAKAM